MQKRIGSRYPLCVIVFLAACCAACSAALASGPGCEPGKVAQKFPSLAGKTVTIALPESGQPFVYRDPADLNHLIGFATDYARGVFDCLGIPLEFKVANLAGAIAAVSAGQADLVWSSIYYTPERAKAMDFVLYQKSASGGIVPKGNPKNIKSFADLCGLSGTGQLGSLEVVKLQEANEACTNAGKPPIAIITSADRASGLRLLDSGRADIMIGIGVKQAYDLNAITFAFFYTSDLKVGVGVAKGHGELEKALVDAFTALQANGLERKLYATYDFDPALSLPPSIVTE